MKQGPRERCNKFFLTSLAGMIGKGTAPGQSMLCASRLTPLDKKDEGSRPIAVGDLIYRLCTDIWLEVGYCLLPTHSEK